MRHVLMAVAAVALAVTAGCGSAKSTNSSSSAAPSTTTEAAAPTATGKAPLVGTPKDEQGYLAALRAVSPALVAKENRALSNGKETCHNLRNEGEERPTVVRMARSRYSTSTVDLTPAQAEQVVAAAERYYCPA